MCLACNESGKRHMIDGMELPNQARWERSEENEPTNTWASWRLTSSNMWKWKTKFKKNISGELENYSWQNSYKRNNTWAVLLLRYSGSFLKWTKDELKEMDQRTRKLMTMHKTMCIKKRGRKRTCQHRRQRWRIDTTTRRLQRKTQTWTDYIHQK